MKRLDTHLRLSAQCRQVVAPSDTSTQALHDPPSSSSPDEHIQTYHTSPDHHSGTVTPPALNRSDLPLLAPFKHPKTTDEWDQDLSRLVVPTVLAASTVEEKNQALRVGIYNYFSTRYGIRNKSNKIDPRNRRLLRKPLANWGMRGTLLEIN